MSTPEPIDISLSSEQKRVIREALIAASIANAEEALELAEEFRYVDYETTIRYVPASEEQDARSPTSQSCQ